MSKLRFQRVRDENAHPDCDIIAAFRADYNTKSKQRCYVAHTPLGETCVAFSNNAGTRMLILVTKDPVAYYNWSVLYNSDNVESIRKARAMIDYGSPSETELYGKSERPSDFGDEDFTLNTSVSL